ncbi:hypothetical protein GOV12_07945 [Candidatus Pacearchaeota archaeon]|nr:hypothetical protein [Candidatus Pacearchaeota archaeon]
MENKLILHRGYKGKYPENSKISIINALNENLPTEIDIRLSKDSVPFIIHDENINELFNGSGKISCHDSDYLKKFQYKIDHSQKLLSLRKLCEILKKNHPDIFIHIKEISDIKETIKILTEFNLVKNINFFACYDNTLELVKIIKDKYSEYKVGLNFVENSLYYNEKYFNMVDFIWADEVTIPWIDKEKIDFSHKLGKKIYAPSPDLVMGSIFKENIKKRWKELLDLGIDGIFTDLPDEFREFKEFQIKNE